MIYTATAVLSVNAIVERAKKDPRVLPLLEDVEKHFEVRYGPAHIDPASIISRSARQVLRLHWDYDPDTKVIGCADTPNAGACLAHELLHMRMDLIKGCRFLYYVCPRNPLGLPENFMCCLNNELHHHKMYPEFVRLGFRAEEFYGGEGEGRERGDSNNGLPIIDAVLSYFSLIAPGGMSPPEQKLTDEKCFLERDNGRYRDALLKIRHAVNDWEDSACYETKLTVCRVWEAIDQGPAWFGYSESDRPPKDGFFVGGEFEVCPSCFGTDANL